MKKTASLAFALLLGAGLSCSRGSPVQPVSDGRLQVFVQWQGQGVPGRRLEIVKKGLVQITDSSGTARFTLPPGSYTLRAFVNGPGPTIPPDIPVTLRSGQTTRVEVADCVLCMTPE